MGRRNPFGPWASVVVEGGDVVNSVEQVRTRRGDAPVIPPDTLELPILVIGPPPAPVLAPARASKADSTA